MKEVFKFENLLLKAKRWPALSDTFAQEKKNFYLLKNFLSNMKLVFLLWHKL